MRWRKRREEEEKEEEEQGLGMATLCLHTADICACLVGPYVVPSKDLVGPLRDWASKQVLKSSSKPRF